MIIVLLIFNLELNFCLLKKKILEQKDVFCFNISDVLVLVIVSIFLSLFDYNFVTGYLVFRFFDLIMSIYYRVVIYNLYYKYFFNINSKKRYNILLPLTSKIRVFFNKNIIYTVVSLFLIMLDFRVWLIYWSINECIDSVGSQLSSDYDQALFGKQLGHDIQITFDGALKLSAYKKYILDNKASFWDALIEQGVVLGYVNMEFSFELHDYYYLDENIQYLAENDCLYY